MAKQEMNHLPFEDLPPAPLAVWREHTGARLAQRFPEVHEAALELVRSGVSLSEVARELGPLCGKGGEGQVDGFRKILRGWIIAAGIDMTQVARMKAAVLRDEALERAADLTPDAAVKDLGALAMLITQANQVERNLGGLPTEIKVSAKLTLEDLLRMKQEREEAAEVPERLVGEG
jgi:hypothetical protein